MFGAFMKMYIKIITDVLYLFYIHTKHNSRQTMIFRLGYLFNRKMLRKPKNRVNPSYTQKIICFEWNNYFLVLYFTLLDGRLKNSTYKKYGITFEISHLFL